MTGKARCHVCKAEVTTILKMVPVRDGYHLLHSPDRRYVRHARPVTEIEQFFRKWCPWPWEPLPVCEGSGKEVR